MSILDLPEELYELIFDDICPSPKSNLRYRQVCRVWHIYTSKAAFRSVTVNNESADGFVSLLMRSTSILADCVQHLTLDIDAVWFRRLLPCLELLGQVKVLELRNLLWKQVPSHTKASFIAKFCPTVRRLNLGAGMVFTAFEEAQHLICEFHELDALSIAGVVWRHESLQSLSQTPKRPPPIWTSSSNTQRTLPGGVRAIHVGQPAVKPLLIWLLSQTNLPRNYSLSIADITIKDAVPVYSFISLPQLQTHYLSMSFDSTTTSRTLCPFTDAELHSMVASNGECFLQLPSPTTAIARQDDRTTPTSAQYASSVESLPNLHTIRIENFIRFEDHARTSASFFAPNVLGWLHQRSKTDRLRKVILCIHLRRVGEIDVHNIHWAMIDQALVYLGGLHSNAPGDKSTEEDGGRNGIEEVAFEVAGGVDIEAISELLRKRLPNCKGANLLTFSPRSKLTNFPS